MLACGDLISMNERAVFFPCITNVGLKTFLFFLFFKIIFGCFSPLLGSCQWRDGYKETRGNGREI